MCIYIYRPVLVIMGGSWGVLQSYAFEHIITYQFWQNYNIEESRGTMSGTNGEKRTHTNTKHVWIVSAKNTLRIKQCNCKSCLSPLVMTWFVNIIGATNAHAKGVELIVWQPHWFLQVLYIAQDIIIWHDEEFQPKGKRKSDSAIILVMMRLN